VDGAGAALRDAAAILRAGKAQLLTQDPEQGRVTVDHHVDGFAINVELGHVGLLGRALADRRGAK
jgi:hypothetical protein